MRIVGEVEHPELKITILHMNMRYAVKFEKWGLEQTYKVRESQKFTSAADVKSAINEELIDAIQENFTSMHKIKLQMISDKLYDDTFEEII